MKLKGHRKWSVCMTVIVLAALLCALGKLSGAEFTMVAGIAVGGFHAANAWGDHKKGGINET